MNFFGDDFGLSSSPVYPKKTSFAKPADQMSRQSGKSGRKDEFGDLLDDLLSNEGKKPQKKRQQDSLGPYSSTQLDFIPTTDFRKAEKWSTPHIDSLHLHESPKFPKSRMNSIEDRGSEDGRSFKSGFTGRQNNFQSDNLLTLRPEADKLERSTRNMMRPPLAKNMSRQASKEEKQPSGIDFSSTDIQFGQRARTRQGRNAAGQSKSVSPQVNFQISDARSVTPEIKEKIIQRQKIVTVREEATELKKQFDTELKEIRESYERQLKEMKAKWLQSLDESAKQKQKLVKEHESRLQEERRRQQTISEANMKRAKEMHEWQLKKKQESYLIQIEKIKLLSKMDDDIANRQKQSKLNQETLEIKAKEKELALQRKRLEDLKYQLEKRQQELEFEESAFQAYRKKQEQKLQGERRTLLEKENTLRRNQLEQKRNYASEKQKLASEMAEAELELIKKREALNLEKEEVRLTRDLLEREKREFEEFNKNNNADYKAKLKELQEEKEKVNDIEIELYKKIQVVDLVGLEQKGARPVAEGRPPVNQQNYRNRSNTFTAGWAQQTKQRFKEMEKNAYRNGLETKQQRERLKARVNVSGYIDRMNRSLSKR